MGWILLAKCGCGFRNKFAYGRGMLSQEENKPYLCQKCWNFIVETNQTPKCPDCGDTNLFSYEHGCLLDDKPKQESRFFIFKKKPLLVEELKHNEAIYRCPKCKGITMEFQVVGLWD